MIDIGESTLTPAATPWQIAVTSARRFTVLIALGAGLLVNRRELMGETRNRPVANVIAWSTAVVMIALTAMMVWTSVAG